VAFDLRCLIPERLVQFLRGKYPIDAAERPARNRLPALFFNSISD
jgi:hypothetical protein